ncbi:STAS domain-containing protein [bacterium]|nr:STAS domain-containing protein [bacterium]
MAEELTLTSRFEKDAVVIKTAGYINNQGGEKIAEESYKYVDKGATKIILDLENSKVVNSIGISILIEVIEQVNEKKGVVVFANLDATVEKTFNIMGLFEFARKASTVEEALQVAG